MQKTRLGIKVGMLGAAIFFGGLFSGYLVAIILAGYVLLFEENAWLRRSAVKAVALMFFFSLLTAVISLIPDAIDFINSVVYIFNGNFNLIVLNKIVNALISGINIVENVLFIGLGYKALSQGTIVIPVVDNLVSKYMD